MQEAYRPPCSEYSFLLSYPGTPPGGTWPGYPPGGTWPGYPPGGVPDPGTPPGGTWPGYPPGGGTWLGYPPRGYLTWVPPGGSGYPPRGGLGTPPASWHSGKCCKALWDMGTPPVDRQIDGWTDVCQNITFPHTMYAGGNNFSIHEKTINYRNSWKVPFGSPGVSLQINNNSTTYHQPFML